jgi:hypothetical protein
MAQNQSAKILLQIKALGNFSVSDLNLYNVPTRESPWRWQIYEVIASLSPHLGGAVVSISEFCLLPTEALVPFLNSNCAVRELRLPVASGQWALFIHHPPRLASLETLTLLPVGDGECIGAPRPPAGRRWPAEDAIEALEKAGVRLEHVRVGKFEWRVLWKEGEKYKQMILQRW